ncbi:hypothetical protein M011DRAFT_481050 [Sporormia fimetaria CBS 119925]|uniref:Uncharacterized protein n=1 Tax=Sporormia fimetaria CBS 119925 TaxID=1340428 RepID=A0A6A6V1A0_9PLEO|nr:hypothetical protein M011DRAFT_481050 [Sporormia fimetaria CBS 119925]
MPGSSKHPIGRSSGQATPEIDKDQGHLTVPIQPPPDYSTVSQNNAAKNDRLVERLSKQLSEIVGQDHQFAPTTGPSQGRSIHGTLRDPVHVARKLMMIIMSKNPHFPSLDPESVQVVIMTLQDQGYHERKFCVVSTQEDQVRVIFMVKLKNHTTSEFLLQFLKVLDMEMNLVLETALIV